MSYDLKSLRRRLHYSQEQMAACLHISRQAYGCYERSERSLPPEVFNRLSSLVDLPITDLLPLMHIEGLTEDEIDLIRDYRSLDGKGQQQIRRALDQEKLLAAYFPES